MSDPTEIGSVPSGRRRVSDSDTVVSNLVWMMNPDNLPVRSYPRLASHSRGHFDISQEIFEDSALKDLDNRT
ncbi:hypothetical protein PV325_000685 [Microctonus aethiopoides]|nr:hypothetical protein PV325_000685 [Microctonus aethiopoides]